MAMKTHPHKVQIPRKAVFLDRDGTLIEDADYLRRTEDIRWVPGVPAALRALQDLGYALVVVSNQSGIARGYFGWSELRAIETTLCDELALAGVHVDGWYYCPHLPEVDGPCACRKPGNGLMEQAIAELGLSRAESFMVGDSLRDVEAGAKSGLRGILVETGKAIPPDKVPQGVEVYPDLPSWVSKFTGKLTTCKLAP